MAYQRKTRDRWDIMTNYGYGWECENSEYTRADARRSLKEYRENCGGSVRLEKHREPVEGYEEKSQLKRESAGNCYQLGATYPGRYARTDPPVYIRRTCRP